MRHDVNLAPLTPATPPALPWLLASLARLCIKGAELGADLRLRACASATIGQSIHTPAQCMRRTSDDELTRKRSRSYTDRCPATRRDRRRRRICWHAHAASTAGRWLPRALLRGWQRTWRHVVLEPLSRRTLRHSQPRLLLFVLERARARMGMERALRRTARNRTLCQSRSGPFRSASPDSIQYAYRLLCLR